ncbi:open rectifier potassium channel protein 1-like [Bacillus rossius redtenbacheri]|uniref:open rectifier potassium channel protein 1-like n=1 Tax=Bacillus rossius redtenbacheri TaxID=93214 RepID=UPI002FDE94B9
MMSKKQWCCLLLLFVAYLLLGAAMFYNIERALELERRMEERAQRNQIYALLSSNYMADLQHSHGDLMDRLAQYCGKPLYNITAEQEGPLKWDFFNSVFFVITVVSTIGYGNLVATSSLSRILMILYALVGIPMNGILLATLGEFFSIHLLRVHRRYKTQKSETRAGLVTDIVLYLVPGFVLFIFLPAGAFVYFEGWDYVEAVYYAFVTLTTIGFGDLVAGQQNDGPERWYTVAYKACLIVWVVFGLGYIVMILGFLTRAMRSKRLARLEHKLAANLRHTHSRLWGGVTRDVAYVRRVLNELYLLKMKVRLLLPASCFLLPSCFFLLLASCPSCFFLSFLLLPAAFFLSFLVLPSCFFLPVLPVLPASCPSSFISFLFPGLPASSCILPASCFLLLPASSILLPAPHAQPPLGRRDARRGLRAARAQRALPAQDEGAPAAACFLLPASFLLLTASCFLSFLLLPVLPASSCCLLPVLPGSSILLLPSCPSCPSCFLPFILHVLPVSWSSCFFLHPSCFLLPPASCFFHPASCATRTAASGSA